MLANDLINACEAAEHDKDLQEAIITYYRQNHVRREHIGENENLLFFKDDSLLHATKGGGEITFCAIPPEHSLPYLTKLLREEKIRICNDVS